MEYINVRSVHRPIGANYPLRMNTLANAMERFLQQVDRDGHLLPRKLSDHNLNGRKNRQISEFAHVDADFRLDLDVDDHSEKK